MILSNVSDICSKIILSTASFQLYNDIDRTTTAATAAAAAAAAASFNSITSSLNSLQVNSDIICGETISSFKFDYEILSVDFIDPNLILFRETNQVYILQLQLLL